jgi:hypothetical protein
MTLIPQIPPAPTAAPLHHIPYKITSQEKTETFTPDGRFQTVWRVGFEAPNGTHAFLQIPDAQYNPAEVDRQVQAQLDTIMGVHLLGELPHVENLPPGTPPPEGTPGA